MYAFFVNGTIEIIPISEHLTYFQSRDIGTIKGAGEKFMVSVDNSTAPVKGDITTIAMIIMIALISIGVHKMPKRAIFLPTYATILANMSRFSMYLRTTYMLRFSRNSEERFKEEEENKPSARALQLFTRFSLAEIRLATKNFSEALVIGRGGFGKVYKGLIDNGRHTPVAIKRLRSYSSQGHHEFLAEINTLCEVRHINLISLVGYCNEQREMILVYEYMSGGTLADHLHKHNNNDYSLTWKQRLNICIGAGRVLDYLHTGQGIIHHDVKTSNILLDENLVAKVADFGLAKPEDDKGELQSEKLKYTSGYLDPHYISTRKLTRESDVYAFGVVLLEVLCERPAIDRLSVLLEVLGDGSPLDQMTIEKEHSLAKWARNRINKGGANEIVASSLVGKISPDSLETFVEVAESCLRDEPNKRPTMSQVVVQLEFALYEQEGIRKRVAGVQTVVTSSRIREGVAGVQSDVTSSPVEQTNDNNEFSTGYRNRQQLRMTNTLCFWPHVAVWNTATTSKKNKLISSVLSEIRKAGLNVQKFDFASIADATNQFSKSNMLGRGGFGPVYKVVLPIGKILAVKRNYPSSNHSIEEFKCEILFLPKLQHRNIIKLLGYCLNRKEQMLIYEFMANRSLDSYIFDEKRSSLLHWALRFKIIVGIAKGILYLHQDSGMRIIHRDIKPSNILLDTQMNPKICDFGLALTFEDDQKLVENVAGTLGYIAPEYAHMGEVSVMSDVYSFGVLILETIHGKRVYDWSHHLFAWKLWNERKALDLVAETVQGSFSPEEALRCIQVGLLCTQWNPSHRPTMPFVLKMLCGEELSQDLHEKVEEAYCNLKNSEYNGICIAHEDMTVPQPLNTISYIDEIREAGIRVWKFDFATIAHATTQFSSSNKIGKGEFGYVYKAMLPTGEIFAVKRLFQLSCEHRQHEIKKEILLLSKLQHCNIIRLFGYCNHGEDVMLVYEFMANQNLNTCIYDAMQRRRLLNWALCFKIIMGIARGIMYLHQEMRIIHGDIKPSNILLDNEMNPKISDFDLARTFEDDQSVVEESRIVGTYGYMAPEYAIMRKKSVVADVYSFGVLVLETLRGRNRYAEYDFDIVAHTWKLWKEGKAVDLVDEIIQGSFSRGKALRCIQISLLCTQKEPRHRPTMPCVVRMLCGEEYSPRDLHDKVEQASRYT